MRSGPLLHLGRPLAVALFLAALIAPSSVSGANRAGDVNVIHRPDRVRLVLSLESPPLFALKPVEGKEVSLRLYDTADTPLLKKRMAEKGSLTVIKGEGETSDLGFSIPTSGPLREVRGSWLQEKKLFILEMDCSKEKAPEGGGDVKATLKGIRFGIQEGATRMVMDLDRKPAWEILYRKTNNLVLDLEALPGSMKMTRFGPFERIAALGVGNRERHLDMDISLEGPLKNFRLFWLGEGNKLVMDLLDQPLQIEEGDLLPEPPPVEAEVKEASPKVQKETQPIPEAPKGPEVLPAPDGPDSMDALSEAGPVVRRKIPGRGSRTSEETPQPSIPERIIHPVDIKVEPEIEPVLPGRFQEKELLQRLSSEEAFLFGRIQEAWEIEDYEKGALLIDQFITRFPDSPMGERISFLSGDFRLALLKGGKEEILADVIKSYQSAISRFRTSREVPAAMIKMAQANAYAGKDFSAIGDLSVALGQYREGDHLPLAYLTRGKVYLRSNQPQKALRDFNTVMERFQGSPLAVEARYGIATYYHSVGLYGEADRELRAIAVSSPDFYLEHPECLTLRAKNYFYQGQYEHAREFFFKALNIGHQPESGDLLLTRLGDTYHHQTMERAAEKFYRMAIDRYPESEGASIAKLRLAGYSSGVTIYREVHEKNPNNPIGELALLKMANRFYDRGNYPMALNTLRGIVDKPDQSQIHRESKDLYCMAAGKQIKGLHGIRDHENLIQFFENERGRIEKTMDPETLLLVAGTYYEKGRHQEAISLFSSIKTYDLELTSRGKFILSLADSLMKSGEEAEAEKLLERSRSEKLLPRDHQEITLILADMRRMKGDTRQARDLYESLTKEKRSLPDSEIAKAYLALGKLSNQERAYEKGRESLNRCIALAEKDKNGIDSVREAFVEIGNSYHFEGKHSQAVRTYLQGFDRGYGPEQDGYWETRFRLALSYMATGMTREARALFNEISEEGDPLLQQKVQIKLGLIDLEDQLKRLPIGPVEEPPASPNT